METDGTNILTRGESVRKGWGKGQRGQGSAGGKGRVIVLSL